MESKIFTARLSHRAILAVGNLSEACAQLWPRLTQRAAEYIAANMRDDRFQLLRILREVNEIPAEHFCELRLIVEAGQVTTRSRIEMVEPGHGWIEDLRRPNPAEFGDQEHHPHQDAFERTFNAPETVQQPQPYGRRIIIDTHKQPA